MFQKTCKLQTHKNQGFFRKGVVYFTNDDNRWKTVYPVRLRRFESIREKFRKPRLLERKDVWIEEKMREKTGVHGD